MRGMGLSEVVVGSSRAGLGGLAAAALVNTVLRRRGAARRKNGLGATGACGLDGDTKVLTRPSALTFILQAIEQPKAPRGALSKLMTQGLLI